MTKKRSIIKFCIIAILILLGLFLTFFNWTIPTTNTQVNSFFNAINYGYDVGGGVLCEYKPNSDGMTGYELDEKVLETVNKLNSSLSSLGFKITKQNSNIRVEISTVSYLEVNNKFSKYGVDVLQLLGNSEELTFSSSSSDKFAEGYVSGKYIEKCSYAYSSQANSWFVEIEFNEEGKVKFKELTSKIAGDSSSKLYMFIGSEVYNSNGFDLDSAVSSLTLTATNQEAAEAMVIQLSTLAKPLTFKSTLSNPQLINGVICNDITPGLNSSTLNFLGNVKNMLIFTLVLAVVLSIVFLCVRYRMLGVMASLSILVFLVIYSFLLQSIPLVLLDFNGIMGVLVVYALLITGFVSIFEKIKKEYSSGKKIPNAVLSGFRKKVLEILEKYCFLLVFSAIFFLVGVFGLKYFAVSIFIGLFVNYFILFVVTRGLCKLYLPINSSNKKLYSLKREDVKNEI